MQTGCRRLQARSRLPGATVSDAIQSRQLANREYSIRRWTKHNQDPTGLRDVDVRVQVQLHEHRLEEPQASVQRFPRESQPVLLRVRVHAAAHAVVHRLLTRPQILQHAPRTNSTVDMATLASKHSPTRRAASSPHAITGLDTTRRLKRDSDPVARTLNGPAKAPYCIAHCNIASESESAGGPATSPSSHDAHALAAARPVVNIAPRRTAQSGRHGAPCSRSTPKLMTGRAGSASRLGSRESQAAAATRPCRLPSRPPRRRFPARKLHSQPDARDPTSGRLCTGAVSDTSEEPRARRTSDPGQPGPVQTLRLVSG